MYFKEGVLERNRNLLEGPLCYVFASLQCQEKIRNGDTNK